MSVPMHEFTGSEIFEAFRPLMPEAEARRMADFLSAPVDMDAILAESPHNETDQDFHIGRYQRSTSRAIL